MSVPISLNISHLAPDVTWEEILSLRDAAANSHEMLHSGAGAGSDYLGWLDPRKMMPAEEVERITDVAEELALSTDVLVVVGIGGSYLGARAAIEALADNSKDRVFFAGQNISAHYLSHLIESLADKRFAINVVSKSGTTTEPAIAFRILRSHLESAVGMDAASELIVATTDPAKGALKRLSKEQKYETFEVPVDVGGRYSVLSAVGLLPMAYAGIDIIAMVEAAERCAKACSNPELESNPAYTYAVARNLLYNKGKEIEILASFEPRLHYLAEWWKQLFGESEGKENKGIFPAAVDFTTDLHSVGQWIQQGKRNIFETFIDIKTGEPELTIPEDPPDLDGLNYLAGRDLHSVNREAYRATALAHREGGVPNSTIRIPRLDEESLGALVYFFEKACAISGYLLHVNPFDQPGVEAYKNHMFALLGKPGFEEQSRALEKELKHRSREQEVRFKG
ncbi:MAG: glucose-6-phosphate isomerase [Armatimonadetes bacterium]|nr:glucose-6-phosphate isomerase [Armatimonadota bacterium]